MNEDILKALMRLFAIVADVNREGAYGNERDIITEYLQRQFSSEHVNSFISYFDQYLLRYHPKFMYENDREAQKQNDYNSAKIVDICNQINEELEQKQKIIVIVYLLDFINRGEKLTENEINFVNLVGKSLKIDPVEFHDLRAFTFGTIVQIKSKTELLYIDANEDSGHPEIKHMKNDRLDGRIRVIRISSANMLVFRYEGRSELFLNGHNIKTNRSYIWSVGSVIKSSRVGSIYYTHVAGKFIQSLVQTKFTFTAKDIEFRFKNSENGIRRFNFSEESGRLIGIIGGSGSGKSTLLNVLNGNLKLRNGSISINNLDLHENKDMLKGLIGYVPQEDLLFKELTVFENLYFNARLCFSDYSKEKITEVVETALMDFDLVEARDLRVGDEVKTILSGGQRKRLNIALELMREPAILFVDEPTSGLSSMDSEKVMSLLKRQTFRGRLVITNIHQPSSDLYKLLDKLLVMDQGGRVIYYGNPIDAISYFKDISHFAAASEAECKACGNINSDQILRIVEARVVDVNGRLTRKRKTSPQEWYDKYTETIDPIIKQIKRTFTAKLPKNNFSIPSRWKQLKIFFSRDLLAKLSNKQYLIITALEAPLLSIILAFFTKEFAGVQGNPTAYNFSENDNLPAYLFMSVIVALFLGLVISAEEIFKDRRILKREQFLNLSRRSYLSSKIMILFAISAIQSIIFVIIGNYVLEIKGMMFYFWLVLFSTACWANMIGLNISAGLNSVVTIYILVPLILVPQLLFSGVVVDFDAMHKSIKTDKHVPLIGDVITSRWSFESLMVVQFKQNHFNRHFYAIERSIDEALYHKGYQIPHLRYLLRTIEQNLNQKEDLQETINKVKILDIELRKLCNRFKINPECLNNSLTLDNFTDESFAEIREVLDIAAQHADNLYKRNVEIKEEKYVSLIEDLGSKEAFNGLRMKNMNKKISFLVTDQNEMQELKETGEGLIRLKSSIYRYPENTCGRAHFFAPVKRIGNYYIDTIWYNMAVIWIFTGLLFIMLYYDILRRVIEYFESLKVNRFNKRFMKVIKQYEAFRR